VAKTKQRRGIDPGPPAPWWAGERAAGALVAALTVIAFVRSLGNQFTYDEGLVIVQAQRFLRSGAVGVLVSKQYFAASLEGTWRPFCTLTYMLDAAVALHPAVFRAQSLAWHVGAALLAMALARRLLPEGRRRFALWAGLVLALHPVVTEAVDNASFREDTLVAFFTLATLVLALDGRPRTALGAYALALLSKESAVVAPALLAGALLVRDGRHAGFRTLARALAPFAVMTALYLGVRFGPLATPGAYAAYPGGSLGGTLLGMPAIFAHDLRLLVAPWPLCADYTGYFRFGRQPLLPFLGALALMAGYAAAVGVAARRGQRLLALGLGWFAVALLPVANLIPVPVPAAERFLYLPLAGVALAAAAAASALAERVTAARARGLALAGAAALAAFVVLINLRHDAWRDDETLWKQTLAVNPRSCGAESAVGGKLLTHGIERDDLDLLRQAAEHELRALALCPDASDPSRAAMVYTRLGAAHAMLGELEPAGAALEHAMALAPRYALPVVWLGYVRSRAGDRAQAALLLQRAIIELGPPDAAVAEVAKRYLDLI
jgi:tetratricopeptide (TPR) repeat protein